MKIPREAGEEAYWERLLQKTDIWPFLPMEIQRVDGKESYCFHTDSKVSLTEKALQGELSADAVCSILTGLSDAIKTAEEHLLEPGGICMDPECIFFAGDEWNPLFCYFLSRERNGGENGMEYGAEYESEHEGILSEYLVDHIDHGDERAVKLAYGYDENCRIGLYDPTDLLNEDQEELGLYYETDRIEKELGLTEDKDSFEEDENYYFCETKEEEEPEHKNLKRTLIICMVLVLACSGAYLFLFMNPEILAVVGISQKHYVAGGAVLAAGLLLMVLNLMKKV